MGKEVFVGVYQTVSTSGGRLASLNLYALQRLQLPSAGLREQCYDEVAIWLESSGVSQPLVALSSDMVDAFIKT